MGSSLGLTIGIGGLEKRKICCPCRESKHDSSDVQPVAWPLHWLSYSGFHHDNTDRFLWAFAKNAYYIRHVSSSAVGLSAQIRAAPISIGGRLRKYVAKHQICLKLDKNIGHFTRRSRYVLTVGSCTKYFAARQQCKGSHLLHFHGATERVCIVDSCVYLNINQKERKCCVPMATTLSERTTLLRRTYIVCLVSLSIRPSWQLHKYTARSWKI